MRRIVVSVVWATFLLVGVTIGLVACGASRADDPGKDGGLPESQSADPSRISARDPLDAAVVLHHWQALNAIRQNARESAAHHIQHIVEAVDGDHRIAMESILNMLEAGDDHAAEHGIEEMLAGRAEPNLRSTSLHLQLALAALTINDAVNASHHMRHIIDHAGVGERVRAQAITALLALGRVADATTELRAFTIDLAREQDSLRRCATAPDTPIVDADGTVPLVLLVDDASDRAASASAVATIREANVALEGLGVSLEMTALREWKPPDTANLHTLADAVIDSFPGPPGGPLLVSFASHASSDRRDGIHIRHPEGQAIVLGGGSEGQRRVQVLVHEVGHTLGLWHQTGTYMQSIGMPIVAAWSECQRQAAGQLFG